MADTAVVARLKAVLTGDSSGLRRDLTQSEKRLKQFGDRASALGRTMTTRVTLPLVGVGAAAVKVAADFEKSMTSITALVGVAREEVQRMEGDVRSMAVQFGKSGTEAANALFFITSAGLRGSVATDTLAASLKASAIGLGDTATIADLATSALNAYGADTLSASQATDVLTAAVREGKLEAGELAGSMGRVLPLASAMNVSFNEVGAAFAALSRTGTNAAEAATQIRGILASLLRPTKQAEEALEGMGLSSEGLRRQMREEGLLATLKTLSEEFAGNEAAAASVFGNIRALSGVLDLMGANVATTEAIFASMADTTGAVDNAFEVVSETASFQFQQAMAEIKESMLTLGQSIMPMVTDALGIMVDIVRDITGAFSGLDDNTKTIIGVIAGITAVAGPAALAVGALSKAFTLLAANPAYLAIGAAIGGIAIALGNMYQNQREARARQEALTEEFRRANDPATTLIDRMSALADEINGVRAAAEGTEGSVESFVGAAAAMAAIEVEGVADDLARVGLTSRDLAEASEFASRDIRNLDDANKLLSDSSNTTAQRLLKSESALGDFVRALYEAEQAGTATHEQIEDIIGALHISAKTFDDHRDKLDEEAKQYFVTGKAMEDFGGILGTEAVDKAMAAAGASDNYSYSLEILEGQLGYVTAELAIAEGYMLDMEAATQAATDGSLQGAQDFEAMARSLVAAGNAAGYDAVKTKELVEQLGILDELPDEIKMELGLDVVGVDAVIDAVQALLNAQMAIMTQVDRIPASIAERSPDIQILMQLLSDLRNIDTDSGGVGGGGGGGGGGLSAPIDDATRAAEEAQRQLDQLGKAVDRLGSSMMGRDFVKDLFGASPDELADIFETIVGEMDDLGMLADQETSAAIARLGEQFIAAASAAEELAEATQALADAQDELGRREQVLADIRDRYADFRKEFGLGQVKIAGDKDPLALALNAIEQSLPKLRAAQDELANLKQRRGSFEEQVSGLFQPSLSPDTNVMAQTQRMLGQAREFRDNLIKLRDKGFPPDVIAEVVNAGLAGGARLSKHLLRLGTGEMADFLRMREEIAAIGASTAKVAGEVLFGADIAGAQGEVDRLVGVVDRLYQNAIAEARKDVDEQRTAVDDLTDALEAATAQMATLVDNIQVNLFNAFNNFLSKLGSEVTTLTTTPVGLSLDLTAIDRLTALIADVTDTAAPAPTPAPGGGGGGGGVSVPAPAPAPAPAEQTYTVQSGDGPWKIINGLLGRWSNSAARRLWQHNGMFYNSASDFQTIHPGQVLRIPALAAGGRARGGMPHLVGEMGPELFVPDSSGYVVPNHALGGGGGDTYVTINTHAGMRAEDVVREIEKYTRKRGNLSIPTVNTRRF